MSAVKAGSPVVWLLLTRLVLDACSSRINLYKHFSKCFSSFWPADKTIFFASTVQIIMATPYSDDGWGSSPPKPYVQREFGGDDYKNSNSSNYSHSASSSNVQSRKSSWSFHTSYVLQLYLPKTITSKLSQRQRSLRIYLKLGLRWLMDTDTLSRMEEPISLATI